MGNVLTFRKSYVLQVCTLLAKNRSGMNARQIFNEMSDLHDLRVLQVTLSRLVKRGILKIDGKIECCECGRPGVCYRITEDGRLWLNSQSEYSQAF